MYILLSSVSRKKREIISTGSSHGQSSDTSDVDSGLQGDVVQQKVKSLAQLVNEGQLGLEAVKPVLHEIAGTMISQIMQSSSVHMEEFLNVIRETTILSESRTPLSRVSTVVSGDDENVYSNFLDDDSALVLAAGFLADLTESVAMHLGDMLEDQLVNVVTVQDEEEEEVEQEREEVEQERKDGEEAIDETSKVPLS
ncbi:unnamed protein product [Calicophoron daubneyi]|uniref:Uncharacterized protein n=1 Tax=Calicophoron daubneyi TaxID=300641 RepID=A0AAV2TEN2_CALDB